MWTHTTLLQICPLQFQRGTDFISSKSMHLFFFLLLIAGFFLLMVITCCMPTLSLLSPITPRCQRTRPQGLWCGCRSSCTCFCLSLPWLSSCGLKTSRRGRKNHPCLYQPPRVTGERLGHVATSLGHAWSPFIPLPQFRSLLSL